MRNPRSQIPDPKAQESDPKSQGLRASSQTRASRTRGFFHVLALVATVLGFGIWDLGFGIYLTALGRQGGAPPTPRAAASVDLAGTWVSVVTEDWRWRMRTPPKGDYASLPLTPAAIKVADGWDPARDTAAGEQCRAYGAPA